MSHELIKNNLPKLLESWMSAQLAQIGHRADLINDVDLKQESAAFLQELIIALASGNYTDISKPEYDKISKRLKDLSRSRAILGFTPSETALFVFSFKYSLLELLQTEYKDDLKKLNEKVLKINRLIDDLGLLTFEEFTLTRESLIRAQQDALFELSAPIVQIWENILSVSLIGIIDSNRAQQLLEALLNRIVFTGSRMIIIDITGVPLVDSAIAKHLINTIKAIQLVGAEGIVTGIRPEVAQSIINIGIDISNVVTKSKLADGLQYCFEKLNLKVADRSSK